MDQHLEVSFLGPGMMVIVPADALTHPLTSPCLRSILRRYIQLRFSLRFRP